MNKKYIITIFVIISISMGLFAIKLYANDSGKCTGSSSCTACSNCTQCKHCHVNGGECGVCK
jgi:hypothetical protein